MLMMKSALKFINAKILELGFETIVKFIAENPRLEVYILSLDNLFRLSEKALSQILTYLYYKATRA